MQLNGVKWSEKYWVVESQQYNRACWFRQLESEDMTGVKVEQNACSVSISHLTPLPLKLLISLDLSVSLYLPLAHMKPQQEVNHWALVDIFTGNQHLRLSGRSVTLDLLAMVNLDLFQDACILVDSASRGSLAGRSYHTSAQLFAVCHQDVVFMVVSRSSVCDRSSWLSMNFVWCMFRLVFFVLPYIVAEIPYTITL